VPLVAFHEPLCVACAERVGRVLAAAGDRPPLEARKVANLSRWLAITAALSLGFALAAGASWWFGGSIASGRIALAALVLGIAAAVARPFVVAFARGSVTPAISAIAAEIGPSLGVRSFLVITQAAVLPRESADSASAEVAIAQAVKRVPALFVVGDRAVALYRPTSGTSGLDEVESAPRQGVAAERASGRFVSVLGGDADRSIALGLDLTPTPGPSPSRALERALGA
jgi:hypothetical protein